MSSNPTKSQAINAETTKNPKEGSDWLGGPQNGSEIPGNGGNGSGNGAVTQNGNETTGESAGRIGTGNIAREVESDYTKHRFNESPSESYFIPRHRNETPNEAAPSSSERQPGNTDKK